VRAGAAATPQHEAALAQVLSQALGGKARSQISATAPSLTAGVEAQRTGEGGRDLLVSGGS
jgi:hypothetical protein